MSSNTDMWAIPQAFFDKMDKEFHFDLDVCATKENAKCARFYTVTETRRKAPAFRHEDISRQSLFLKK